jgi:hypothetical protein
VILYWATVQGGPGFPTTSTVNAGGFFVAPWAANGIEFFDLGDGNHTVTVNENSPSVPEPSTLFMGLTAALGLLAFRRRHQK